MHKLEGIQGALWGYENGEFWKKMKKIMLI